jgi:hypothetical protein
VSRWHTPGLALETQISGVAGGGGRERTLNNGIDGARLLAEAAVDALGHINIVSRSPSRTIITLLCLDCDSQSRAHLFTISTHSNRFIGIHTASQSLQAMHRSSPVG